MVLEIERRAAEALSPRALSRLRELEELMHEATALENVARAPLRELSAERDRLRLAQTNATKSHPFSPRDAKRLAALNADHDAVMAKVRARHVLVRSRSQLFARVTSWLDPFQSNHLGPSDWELRDVELPVVAVLAARLPAALSEVREKIDRLKAEAKRIADAPQTLDEIRAFMARYVAGLVENGRPRLHYLAVGTSIGNARRREPTVSWLPSVPPHAIVAWLDPGLLINRLVEEFAPTREGAVTAAEKEEAAEKFARELEASERLEEELVRASPDGVERRIDATPEAVLGVTARPRGRRKS